MIEQPQFQSDFVLRGYKLKEVKVYYTTGSFMIFYFHSNAHAFHVYPKIPGSSRSIAGIKWWTSLVSLLTKCLTYSYSLTVSIKFQELNV